MWFHTYLTSLSRSGLELSSIYYGITTDEYFISEVLRRSLNPIIYDSRKFFSVICDKLSAPDVIALDNWVLQKASATFACCLFACCLFACCLFACCLFARCPFVICSSLVGVDPSVLSLTLLHLVLIKQGNKFLYLNSVECFVWMRV